MDSLKYENNLLIKEKEFEDICDRCGECCGSKDDPCVNLKELDDGTFLCVDYGNRLKKQTTLEGHVFNCVSIREHIAKSTLRQDCAYRQL